MTAGRPRKWILGGFKTVKIKIYQETYDRFVMLRKAKGRKSDQEFIMELINNELKK
jgi:hypothetical protein